MFEDKLQYKIGEKVQIKSGDAIQTHHEGFGLVYLFRKKNPAEVMDYYIHDIKIVHTVKEGFKDASYLISTSPNELERGWTGWVGEYSIKLAEEPMESPAH